MKKLSRVSNKVNEILQKAEMALGSLCLFALLAIMLLNVFMRYILAKPLFWADEITNFLFVWFGLLGVAYIMGDNGHLRVNSLIEKLPHNAQKILSILMNLIMLVLFSLFIFSSFRLLRTVTFSGILRIPLKYIYAILPLSFGLMCVHIINNILQTLWPTDTGAVSAAVDATAEKGE